MIYVKDDNKKNYLIKNIKKFYEHILKYHSSGISIHEESGHYFTVDNNFRKQIKDLYDNID